MPRTITVGLDGSPESFAAADWAAREALLRDVPLRLVHAWDRQPYPYAPLAGAAALRAGIDAQREWAENMPSEAASRLARRHPGLRITTHQIAEQPVSVLLAAAENADLLVLGSRGLGGVAGFLVGSVALAVVARTERPVVLVRAGERAEDEHLPDATGTPSTATPYRDVVLGLDLDNPSDPVIEFAFDAALRRAADLRVIHGWSPPPYFGYGGVVDPGLNAELTRQVGNGLTDMLQPWKNKFPGVEVREQAVVGGAGPHLVDASRDAALVVVGRRKRRTPVGSHIGPVTHAALHHACAPVAVIPHD